VHVRAAVAIQADSHPARTKYIARKRAASLVAGSSFGPTVGRSVSEEPYKRLLAIESKLDKDGMGY